MYKKSLLSIAFLLMFSILAACSNDGAEEENAEPNPDEVPEQAEMPEPDLEGIPDIVAEVNEEEIAKDEFETNYMAQFQQAALQMQMSGQELDQDQLKQQVVEGMIGQELLTQEANNEGIEASEEEINSIIDDLIEQNGFESEEDLFAVLEEQGTDQEDFMQQVETQAKVDSLIISESSETLEASEEEIQQLYDQMVEQQEQLNQGGEEQDIPELEEVREGLEDQIIMQKESEVAQELVNRLRENAEISIHL
ncbi:SurA N-terminal domain-containing protein [Amphibacillus sp. Q70]|uniref:SurA N-terminal domain-containing protein n=1 Tax=Amphibacillus sp. Q70 TaxID=3453416 RepID=UPI003F86629C